MELPLPNLYNPGIFKYLIADFQGILCKVYPRFTMHLGKNEIYIILDYMVNLISVIGYNLGGINYLMVV